MNIKWKLKRTIEEIKDKEEEEEEDKEEINKEEVDKEEEDENLIYNNIEIVELRIYKVVNN